MFSAFGKGPTASGTGLYDIERVLLGVAESRVKNSPVPLAVGPLPNAENMESLLPIA